MTDFLKIAGSLDHDGDGLLRFSISAAAGDFSGEALAYGNAQQLLQLANLLEGFPTSTKAEVTFRFGTAKSGSCELQFYCWDGAGHAALKATIVSDASFRSTANFNKATLNFRVEANALDEFISSLRAFHAGAVPEARLIGVPEYF